MKTIRLSDLVEQGRLARGGELQPEQPRPAPRLASVAAAVPAPPPPPPPPRPRVADDVGEKFELLAVRLLSISKSNKADPEALMREALISIDQCIVSIEPHH